MLCELDFWLINYLKTIFDKVAKFNTKKSNNKSRFLDRNS